MCCLCLFALLAVVMLCLAFGVVTVVGVVVDGVVVYSVCCLCRLFSLLLFGF